MKSKVRDKVLVLRQAHLLLFKVWSITAIILALGVVLAHFYEIHNEPYVILGGVLFIFDSIFLPILFGAYQLFNSFKLGFLYNLTYFKYHFVIASIYVILFIAEILLGFKYSFISIFGEASVIGIPVILAIVFCYVLFFQLKTKT